MGCCYARKPDDTDTEYKQQTANETIDIHIDTDREAGGAADTQRLLSRSPHRFNQDYLATAQSAGREHAVQTPPMIRSLLLGDDDALHDTDLYTLPPPAAAAQQHDMKQEEEHKVEAGNALRSHAAAMATTNTATTTTTTTMGGELSLGLADNAQPLSFRSMNMNMNTHSHDTYSHEIEPGAEHKESTQEEDEEWAPQKPSMLLGLVPSNTTIAFNDRYTDNTGTVVPIESMAAFTPPRSTRTSRTTLFAGNTSLNSARLADQCIAATLLRQTSNASSASASSSASCESASASASSSTSARSRSHSPLQPSVEPQSQPMRKRKRAAPKYRTDRDNPRSHRHYWQPVSQAQSQAHKAPHFENPAQFEQVRSWMITAYNCIIEFCPYKHVMQHIFEFCALDVDLGDATAMSAQYDLQQFAFPSTQELDAPYNYYDAPQIFVENVSTSNPKQPSLVIMIGAPGSGKTSYAYYRFGAHMTVSADDYFHIYHRGEFVGAELDKAHAYCLAEVRARLYRQQSVCVANTHCQYWHMYDKVVPVVFDSKLIHKLVYCVMPECNPSTLVRRCVHQIRKTKISLYIERMQQMMRRGPICSRNVLKYGNGGVDPNAEENEEEASANATGSSELQKLSHNHAFDYGLFVDADSYYALQDWFQQHTQTTLLSQLGDGRVSPLISEPWKTFTDALSQWAQISRWTAKQDPVLDMRLKVTGVAVKHGWAQMVTVEIDTAASVDTLPAGSMQRTFWSMFSDGTDLQRLGCVLAMDKRVPFTNAKLLFEYDCVQYVDNGPVLHAQLTTKRYARLTLKYQTPPPLITVDRRHGNRIKVAPHQTQNIFFSLHDVTTSKQGLFSYQSSDSTIASHQRQLQDHAHEQNDIAARLNPEAKEFDTGNYGAQMNAKAHELQMNGMYAQMPTHMNQNQTLINNQSSLSIGATEFVPDNQGIRPQPPPHSHVQQIHNANLNLHACSAQFPFTHYLHAQQQQQSQLHMLPQTQTQQRPQPQTQTQQRPQLQQSTSDVNATMNINAPVFTPSFQPVTSTQAPALLQMLNGQNNINIAQPQAWWPH